MKKLSRYLFLLLTLHTLAAQSQTLIINEVMPANLGEAIDPSWNFGGWIELYNPGNQNVSLTGMKVSDDKGHSYTLTRSHGSVPAKGFKNIWFGHNDSEFATQVDFKLNCDGGNICLVSSTGQTIDAVTYPESISHCSWSRTTDGGTAWSYCAWPTSENSNNSGQYASTRLAPPTVSHLGGWLEGTQRITVTVPEGADLYYSQDGTMPTLASKHATPDAEGHVTFDIDATAVYRFRAIAHSTTDALLPSPVVTRSFISRTAQRFVEGGWVYGDYDYYWQDDHYEKVQLGQGSLLSVVTDPSYLYDDRIGIYVEGTNGTHPYVGWSQGNYYRNWDRPVNAELFDTDATLLFNQEVDMAIAGGYSRMRTPKSFKLKSSKKFEGQNYYPLTGIFPEKEYIRSKDIHVRTGGTSMIDRHQDNALQYIVRQSGLHMNTLAYRPVYVFLNGEFQELLFLREPSNKHYGYANYGMNTDEMDTLEESDLTNLTVHAGTLEAFDALYAASSKAATNDNKWEEVRQLIDVDELANYFALELYLANGDWPQNNIKLFRDRSGGRFHLVLQDLDACFHDNTNTFDRIEREVEYNFAVAGAQENRMLRIFLNLMAREEFRQRFVDAYCLVAGSVMEPTYVASTLDRLYQDVAPLYASFQDKPDAAFSELRRQLSTNYAKTRLNYMQRWSRSGVYSSGITATIRTSTPAAALLLNGQPIPRGTFSGTLYPPVTLQAEAAQGYDFVGWEKNGSIVSKDPSYSLTSAGQYRAVFAATTQQSRCPVVVNEVSAGNGIYQSSLLKRSDWIELYNTTDTPVSIAGLYISDDATDPHKYQIPATDATATTLPAYGHLLLWADDNATAATPGEIHLPFKLANAAEQHVILTSANDEWSDTLCYHAHGDAESVGRWPDGGRNIYRLNRPSIGQSNLLTSYAERLSFAPILTQIDQTPAEEANAAPQRCYDLLGRSYVRQPQKGLYIQQGNLTVKY